MPKAQEYVQEFRELKSGRSVWESHWREIAERVLPRYADTFLTDISAATPGDKKTEKMFDSTAALALDRFAAAMESMLTPRNSRWHRLRASDEALNRDRGVQLWFEEATNVLFRHRYRPKANYASQQHETYLALGAFGTGAIFVDEMVGEPGLRYRAIPLHEVLFLENFQGIVDVAYREFEFSKRQIEQQWPDAPDDVKKKVDGAGSDKKHKILHVVRPRDDYDPRRADAQGMPFMSMYVFEETSDVLSEGGFRTFPYAISRYVTAPGEVYGRSPAMLALPAIKALNEEKKTILKQGHRAVDPVLLAHDDGVLDTLSMKPGALNYGGVTADGRRLVHELPVGNLAVGQEMMDMERSVINEAFLVNLFQILVDNGTMTATEVLERSQEKGALLSPTMGRQQSEALGPMIERELDILSTQGVLPPMPPALVEAEGEYEVEYDSPLSRAQRAEEAAGLARTWEMAASHASITGSPDAFDLFNVDEAVRSLAGINAVPASWLRSAQEVEQIRQQRAQAQQTQQMLDAAPSAAAVMKATQGAQR